MSFILNKSQVEKIVAWQRKTTYFNCDLTVAEVEHAREIMLVPFGSKLSYGGGRYVLKTYAYDDRDGTGVFKAINSKPDKRLNHGLVL